MGFLKKVLGVSIAYSIYRILKDNSIESKKTLQVLADNFETFKPKLRELIDDITVYMDASRGISEVKDKTTIEDRLHDLKVKIESINSRAMANEAASLTIDASSYINQTKKRLLDFKPKSQDPVKANAETKIENQSPNKTSSN